MSSDNLPPGYTGSDDFGCGSDYRFARRYSTLDDYDDEYHGSGWLGPSPWLDWILLGEQRNDWGE